jgi:deoxynucleoside triphosphate triphosphohydrolase SAMHD1
MSGKRSSLSAFSGEGLESPPAKMSSGARRNSFQPLSAARREASKSKVFNDIIHNHITLDALSLKIIDTSEYQRLHKLKQLGTTDFVYRCATHTRFEHSLGVAHLAEEWVKRLQSNQPELEINDNDVLSVKIAGLCHDLGHGPYSHVFDGEFIKKIYPSENGGIDGRGGEWEHERGSVDMLKCILKKYHINLSDFGLTERDLLFIEEIILGVKDSDRRGREPSKFYLYDIVNNTRSGLDVDKFDYFQRDMMYTNVGSNGIAPEIRRMFDLGRVMKAQTGKDKPDELTICYPEKLATGALSIFATRFQLHQKGI